MEILFLEAPYQGKVELCSETLNYLKKKKYKTVALFASVQFVNNLDTVKKQLEENQIRVIMTTPDRVHVRGQLLGCNNFHGSLNLQAEVDSYLYLGDGRFHPLALVYSQKNNLNLKEVICNDPLAKKITLLTINDVKSILKKYKGALIKFLSSKKVGVIITIKPGQEQFRPSLKLAEKFPDKQFYYFVDNAVSFDQLENFPFIDVWVNTACPRLGFDEQEKFVKGAINLTDALAAEEILSRESVLSGL